VLHPLRHTFATHAARFGVNPWRLQAWLGHSTINMTMRYVNHVEEHHRPIPEEILAAGNAVIDPDAASSRCSAPVPTSRVATAWQRNSTPSREPNATDDLTRRRDPLPLKARNVVPFEALI
jgi:integrase-like protein